MTVPVLWQPRTAGHAERKLRATLQVVLLALSAVIVAYVFVLSVRVDRVLATSPCGRGGHDCVEGRCPIEGEATAPCNVVEGRRYLNDHGMLDEAGALYYPTLVVLRDLPAVGLLVASLVAAPPPRLRDETIRLGCLAALAVLVLLVFIHVAFGKSISYATEITD